MPKVGDSISAKERAKYARAFLTEKMERDLDEVRARIHMADLINEWHEEALLLNSARRAA